MLPSKGYFNSLECPFYCSATNCLRPYCHFKHPKKDPLADKNGSQSENPAENVSQQQIVDSKPQVPLHPVPVVKHIPIASIPTKPSAISVKTKKSRSTPQYFPIAKVTQYEPTAKNSHGRTMGYEPISDSTVKTYSRYSYEKGHDSGDEIMENHKSLIETNHISKSDDTGSKHDETDDEFSRDAVFSPQLDEDDVDVDVEPTHPLLHHLSDSTADQFLSDTSEAIPHQSRYSKCKKKNKRKYEESNDNQVHASSTVTSKDKTEKTNRHSSNSVSPKRIKIEGQTNHSPSKNVNKKPCKHKDKKKQSSEGDGHSTGNKKHSSGSKKHTSDSKKISSESNKHSSDNKKHSTEKNKMHSNAEKSLSKSHSSDHRKSSSSDITKIEEPKKGYSDSNKSSPSNGKKNSSDKKTRSSENKMKRTCDVDLSSGAKKHSSENKKHSSDKKKPSSNSEKHSSSSNNKKSASDKNSRMDKDKKSSKNKESSSKTNSSEKKHTSTDRVKKHVEKNSRDSRSSSQSYSRSRDVESKSRESEKRSRTNLDRKYSISNDDNSDHKETILISDSSESGISDRENFSPPDIADILGLSSDSSLLSDHEDEYSPTAPLLHAHGRNTSYRPTSTSSRQTDQQEDSSMEMNFTTAPASTTEEHYTKPTTSVKVRIAHVPNVSSLLTAKTMFGSSKSSSGTPTVHKVAPLGGVWGKSSATVPGRPGSSGAPGVVVNSGPRPQITMETESIVSLTVRQPGLNNIFDELIKFLDYNEAFSGALVREKEICDVATNPQSYRSRIALCILRIRKSKGLVEQVKKELITSASKPEYTYGLTLYDCFSKYLLQPEDYVLHGYPLELPGKPGCVYIDKNSYFRNKHTGPTTGPFRKCINCSQEYAVDEETNMPLSSNDCHHHWGKPIGMRQGKIYSCCKSEVGSEPCHTSLYHVTEMKTDDCLDGFVRTSPYPSDADPSAAGIYAMDCEMCYTTGGRDIVRASLLAVDNETIYDVLIKPKNPVLDYCTRFSGITEEKLAPVTTTLGDVQKFLLKTLNDKTILVGHSLENDLKALKVMHYNVVDTSLMFPHKEGLPIKCALRTLCSRILGTAIQTGENGHDSLEDSRACLQLVLHQIRQDAKARKPRVVKQLNNYK